MSKTSIQFEGATVTAKANVYFDGKVVSHTLHLADGSEKTLGLIFPGEYHFATGMPERMDIIAGTCDVTLDGSETTVKHVAPSTFNVAGKSGFTIRVEDGIAEYVCSFE